MQMADSPPCLYRGSFFRGWVCPLSCVHGATWAT